MASSSETLAAELAPEGAPGLGPWTLPTDPRRTYRLFGGILAGLATSIGLLRGLEAGQPSVGAVFGLVLGGLGFLVFRKLGTVHAHGGEEGDAAVSPWPDYLTEAIGKRALGFAPAGVWVLGVLLFDHFGIRPGPLGTVAIATVGCVALWKAAVTIPRIERWLTAGG